MDICLANDDGTMPADMSNITLSVSDNPDHDFPQGIDWWANNTLPVLITKNSSLFPNLVGEQNPTLRTMFSQPQHQLSSSEKNYTNFEWQSIVASSLIVSFPTPGTNSTQAAPCLRVDLTYMEFVPHELSLGIRLSFANNGWVLGPIPKYHSHQNFPGGQYAYVNLATQTLGGFTEAVKPTDPLSWSDCSRSKTMQPLALNGDQIVDATDIIDEMAPNNSFVVCDAVATKVSYGLSESMQLVVLCALLFCKPDGKLAHPAGAIQLHNRPYLLSNLAPTN